jgi:GTP pyrophosphokinase
MRQVNIQSHDGIFEGTLSLYVRDAESLNALQERLRRIKGMDSVKRVNNQ